jgi:hypothetical protein
LPTTFGIESKFIIFHKALPMFAINQEHPNHSKKATPTPTPRMKLYLTFDKKVKSEIFTRYLRIIKKIIDTV